MENKPLIIGITGAFGSGKSTAADFFSSKGFTKIMLSSFLEEEAKKRGISKITRKILQDIGNEWRKKYGKGILAKKALKLVNKEKIQKSVIDGIRNIGEIEALSKYNNFVLLGIIADRVVRFDRLRKLKRRENLTWDVFTKLDYRDLGINEEKTGLQVAVCVALADIFITNNDTYEDFITKLKMFMQKKGI